MGDKARFEWQGIPAEKIKRNGNEHLFFVLYLGWRRGRFAGGGGGGRE